jgi:hypothetical protein
MDFLKHKFHNYDFAKNGLYQLQSGFYCRHKLCNNVRIYLLFCQNHNEKKLILLQRLLLALENNFV